MTDLSKCTLAELEAEIERRKAEPDWAAWEPKRKAFNVAINSVPPNMNTAHQRQMQPPCFSL